MEGHTLCKGRQRPQVGVVPAFKDTNQTACTVAIRNGLQVLSQPFKVKLSHLGLTLTMEMVKVVRIEAS